VPTTEQAVPDKDAAGGDKAAEAGDKRRRQGGRQGRKPRRRGRQEREEVSLAGAYASSSAWAIRARSTSARATTPASGCWSASPAIGSALRKDGKYQALVGRIGSTAPGWSAAELHESSGQRGADARRLLQDPAGEILVVHDELDFAPGTRR
jgi:hypothetical protein